MADDFKLFPKGQIALDSGDLIQVTNVKQETTTNAKVVHTIRRKGAGATLGVEESTLSFDAVCDEDGFERDYLKMVKKGTVKQVRIKVPGETLNFVGVASKRSLELPLDDAIKYTIEMVGRVDD
jgi:hypothetical protein